MASGVRLAAVSTAKAMTVPIASILAMAGWSTESNFARFYVRPLIAERDNFQDAVLA